MNCRGMTLLEVLIATLILALAGLALLKSSGEQVRNLSYLQQKQVAAWVADNELARLRLTHQWPAETWHEGYSDMAGERWFWRWRGYATSSLQVRKTEIEVASDERWQHRFILLETYGVKG